MEQQIKQVFNKLEPKMQVVIYALALRNEYYELLTVIDNCIPSAAKQEFLKKVNNYNNGK